MYGKLFEHMYDGTLATRGPWQALVTFQQLIILADKRGDVDMTHEAISRRTTIPLEIIQQGIQALEQPDSASRSPALEGRRIVRLSENREWGWNVVNYGHYRKIRSQDERREYMRNYQRKRREAVNREVNTSTTDIQNQPIAVSSRQYAASRKNKDKTNVGLSPDPAKQLKNSKLRQDAADVIAFLNAKAGRNFETNGANADHVVARLKEGATVDDCRAIIALKAREWSGDEKMVKYLRPETLFNRTKFATYKGELGAA